MLSGSIDSPPPPLYFLDHVLFKVRGHILYSVISPRVMPVMVNLQEIVIRRINERMESSGR